MTYTNWRDDPGLKHQTEYRKCFAFLPVRFPNGEKIWLKHYYKKYDIWGHESYTDWPKEYHTDFNENITEAEYIIRKLAENL